LSAAIKAEQLRGKRMGFYAKQFATGDVDDFSRMTDAELDG